MRKEPARNVTLYLPEGLIGRVDEYAAEQSARAEGVPVARSQAVKTLLLRALSASRDEGGK